MTHRAVIDASSTCLKKLEAEWGDQFQSGIGTIGNPENLAHITRPSLRGSLTNIPVQEIPCSGHSLRHSVGRAGTRVLSCTSDRIILTNSFHCDAHWILGSKKQESSSSSSIREKRASQRSTASHPASQPASHFALYRQAGSRLRLLDAVVFSFFG